MGAKVTLTANKALREKMQKHHITLWMIADETGVTDSVICRKLRYELKGQDKEMITGAIERIIAAAANKDKSEREGQEMANKEKGNSVKEGLTKGYTRATFILKIETLEKFKDYAYTERLSITEAINNILESALAAEEQRLNQNGDAILIKPRKDKRGATK